MKTNLDTTQTLTIESNTAPYLRQMTLGEVIAAIEARGITMEQSISGYWRAIKNGETFWDDSASDEAYDELSAIIIVYGLLTNNGEE